MCEQLAQGCSLSFLQAVNPSGEGSATLSFSHSLGQPLSRSPFGTIPCVLHREPQVLHVVLDDVGPSLSLSSSTPLSMNVCLEDSFDTVIIFSPLYMSIPSQPGLAYLVRDACYSNDATDSSFLFLSFRVRPRIQRNILISVLSRPSSSRLLNVRASEPYISTGLFTVLYTFPLIAMSILRAHNAPVNSCHFIHAAAILALMSSSLPPWA